MLHLAQHVSPNVYSFSPLPSPTTQCALTQLPIPGRVESGLTKDEKTFLMSLLLCLHEKNNALRFVIMERISRCLPLKCFFNRQESPCEIGKRSGIVRELKFDCSLIKKTFGPFVFMVQDNYLPNSEPQRLTEIGMTWLHRHDRDANSCNPWKEIDVRNDTDQLQLSMFDLIPLQVRAEMNPVCIFHWLTNFIPFSSVRIVDSGSFHQFIQNLVQVLPAPIMPKQDDIMEKHWSEAMALIDEPIASNKMVNTMFKKMEKLMVIARYRYVSGGRLKRGRKRKNQTGPQIKLIYSSDADFNYGNDSGNEDGSNSNSSGDDSDDDTEEKKRKKKKKKSPIESISSLISLVPSSISSSLPSPLRQQQQQQQHQQQQQPQIYFPVVQNSFVRFVMKNPQCSIFKYSMTSTTFTLPPLPPIPSLPSSMIFPLPSSQSLFNADAKQTFSSSSTTTTTVFCTPMLGMNSPHAL